MLSDQVLECKDVGACICAMNDAEVMSHVQFEVMLEFLDSLLVAPTTSCSICCFAALIHEWPCMCRLLWLPKAPPPANIFFP